MRSNELYGTNPNVIAFLSPAAPFFNKIYYYQQAKFKEKQHSNISYNAYEKKTLECVFSFQ